MTKIPPPSSFRSYKLNPTRLSPKTSIPKMASIISKIPSRSLARLSLLATVPRSLSTAAESQTQKLERIADELLSLTKLEKYDYSVLFSYKMGFNKYGPAVTGLGSTGTDSAAAKAPDAKAADKVVFDVKLEKFDAAAKIKIIKEVRAFTDLGLKEAKDLVEKAPIVVKKGITKEEGESIMAKLKALGATVMRTRGVLLKFPCNSLCARLFRLNISNHKPSAATSHQTATTNEPYNG